MRTTINVLFLAAAVALAGCAGAPAREEPHHYSTDKQGNRLACYTTDVASEYECVPVNRDYTYGPYDPFYDPWWPRAGYAYGGWYPYPYRYPVRPQPRPWWSHQPR